MATFKYKPHRLKYINNIDTLECKHYEYLQEFKNKRDKKEQIKKKIELYTNQLNNIGKTNIDGSLKIKLNNDINKLEKEYDNIHNCIDELEYFSKTHDTIFDYYDIIDKHIDKNNIFKNNELNNINQSNNESNSEYNDNLLHNDTSNDEFIFEINDKQKSNDNESNKLDILNKISQNNRKIKKIAKKRLRNNDITNNNKSIIDYFINDTDSSITTINKNNSNIYHHINNINHSSIHNELINTNHTNTLTNNHTNTLTNNHTNTLTNNHTNTLTNNHTNTLTNNHTNTLTNNHTLIHNHTHTITNNTNNTNRATLLNEYLDLLDFSRADNKIKISNIKKCPKCNKDKIIIYSDGIYVCTTCGDIEQILVNSDLSNYKDCLQEKPAYPYKRLNHFCEWLSQFQAKESTIIPDTIYETIYDELKKNSITKNNKITHKKMKEILKKLRLHQYYEHIPHIISRITGKPPPTISRETEEKLKIMFRDIQAPFAKHCPPERINFLSYSYVLHKFCQLLELDEFIKCFPLLKSREKLRLQDRLWKDICKELKWQFYPSI